MKDFLDAEVPAHITIHKNMQGVFQFGFVQGEIDGRGWLQISGNTGTGCFYFHMGDESDFTVIREDLPAS